MPARSDLHRAPATAAPRPSARPPGARIDAIVVLGAALLLAAASPAGAQDGGRGYLFGPPTGFLTFRAGVAQPSAGGDLFDDLERQLTLGAADFRSLDLGLDLGIRVAPRADVVLGVGYADGDVWSEFRDFTDQDDLPIEQRTRLRRVPITASVKAYLVPRGRAVGRFAWIPTRLVPYVGAGGGLLAYKFVHEGDFIDFETFDVFSDRFESSGWTGTAHGMLGLDYSLTPRIGVNMEGRYGYARAELGRDFEDYDPIDLSGFSATVGLTLRF